MGLEFAKLLAADRHDLVLIARSGDKLDAIASGLRERYGVNVDALVLDLSKPGAAATVSARIPECGGEFARAYVPGMGARGSGRILNVASTAGMLPGPFMAVYYACKAYVLSFSQALAEELRGTGVSVTCLAPGATATGFAERASARRTPLFSMLPVADASCVARAGYDAMMRGRDLVIPGFGNKLVALAARLTPRRLLIWFSRKTIE